MGDELEVKILRVDIDDRKIGLSRKRVDWTEEENEQHEEEAAAATAAVAAVGEENLKGGIGAGEGPLFKAAGSDAPAEEAAPAEAPAEETSEEA